MNCEVYCDMQEELDYHWDNCRVAKGAHIEHWQINLKYFLIM